MSSLLKDVVTSPQLSDEQIAALNNLAGLDPDGVNLWVHYETRKNLDPELDAALDAAYATGLDIRHIAPAVINMFKETIVID